MDFVKYENFYINLLKRFRWPSQVVFIDAVVIVFLYKAFRDNAPLIASYPRVFYSRLHVLLSKTDKKDSIPFKKLTMGEVTKAIDDIKKEYRNLNMQFLFSREEFA